MLQQFIIPAISFGVSATTLPGPSIAYLVNTTLTQGWRKALLVVLAPFITDPPIILLMVFILEQMPDSVLKMIQIGGGLLLYFIAWGAWQQYQSDAIFKKVTDEATARRSGRQVLATGVMMNFLSPGPYLFWGTINGPLLVKALELSVGHAIAFLIAFYGTFLLGLSSWVLLFHFVGKINERYLKMIILGTIVLLLGFGTSLILSAIG
jgi:threonine/homoserine/homoserine lactone efflux protein